MNKDSLPNWRQIPPGGRIVTPGNSENYHTGNWSAGRICFHAEKCKQCGLCFAHCPDCAILKNEKGQVIGVDPEHCKGCGLCTRVCKFGALEKF